VQVVSALLRGSWQDFNWHDASRGPSAIAELLVVLSDKDVQDVQYSLLFWWRFLHHLQSIKTRWGLNLAQ